MSIAYGKWFIGLIAYDLDIEVFTFTGIQEIQHLL